MKISISPLLFGKFSELEDVMGYRKGQKVGAYDFVTLNEQHNLLFFHISINSNPYSLSRFVIMMTKQQ